MRSRTRPTQHPANHSPVPRKATGAVLFGSLWLTGRAARRAAAHDLRNGREPARRYSTGKGWND